MLLGWWMNKMMSDQQFSRIITIIFVLLGMTIGVILINGIIRILNPCGCV